MSDLILRTHVFLRNFPRLDAISRRATAEELEAALRDFEARLPPSLSIEAARSPSATPDALRQASLSLMTWSSVWYVRCVLTRVFLTDAQAPHRLRYAALGNAWDIIELMHSIISLSSSPWIAFPTGWTTEHVFAAATTVVSLFDVEQQPAISRDDLARFASVLQHIKSVLEILAANDVIAAGICKDILAQCCDAEAPLRERIKAYSGQSNEYDDAARSLRRQHQVVPDCVVVTRASTPAGAPGATAAPDSGPRLLLGDRGSDVAPSTPSNANGGLNDEGLDSLLGIFNLAESDWRELLQ